MKLTAKILVVLLLAMIVMTAVASYFSVRGAYQDFENQQREAARRLGSRIQQRLAESWERDGLSGVFALLSDAAPAGSDFLEVRWVWFETEAPTAVHPRIGPEYWAPLVQGDMVTLASRDARGQRLLLTYVPITLHPGRIGGLEFAASLAPMERQMRRTVWTGLLSIGALAAVSVAVIYLAGVHWVAGPLAKLVDKTQRIGAGDLAGPVELPGNDELSQLGHALNRMCQQLGRQQATIASEAAERLATLEQLRHADRLKTVGRLAAGIAHELGTPLNVVAGRAALIASGKLTTDEIQASARTITSEADRITGIVRQLLDFARGHTPQRSCLDLGALVGQTIDLLRPLADKHGVRFQVPDVAPQITVAVDGGQMQQVFTNVVVNAIQAMPEGGLITIEVGQRAALSPPTVEANPGGFVCVAVTDQGCGIQAEDLKHIFEPFYTTKDVGEGTGLGLSIAHGIVEEHGGWIEVASEPGKGTRFEIFLPLEQQS